MIFEMTATAEEGVQFFVRASYLEIYLEKIRDLLDPKKDNLQVREDKERGVWVDGATEVFVSGPEEVLEVMRVGESNRAKAATQMNADSSRSHSIFSVSIEQSSLHSRKTSRLYLGNFT